MMDWGRGVWPHDNVWYWGTASARYNGKPLDLIWGMVSVTGAVQQRI